MVLRRLPAKPDLSPMDKQVRRRCTSKSENGLPCARHDGHTKLRLTGSIDWPMEFREAEVDHVGAQRGAWYAW